MTELGVSHKHGQAVYTHVNGLKQLPGGAVIRNACSTLDPLSKGTFFIHTDRAGEWAPYDPKKNAQTLDAIHGTFKDEQIFLPVEQVSAQRLLEYRQELKLLEEVVKPVRDLFERVLGATYYCRFRGYDWDTDDDDVDEYVPVDNHSVDRAWLAVVKHMREVAAEEKRRADPVAQSAKDPVAAAYAAIMKPGWFTRG